MENKEAEKPEEVKKMAKDYSTIKRMLATLDKFLLRRILTILGIYFAAMVACSAVLITNGITTNASTGEGVLGGNTANAWIYAVIATVSFIFLVALIRFIFIRKNKRQLTFAFLIV